MPLGFNPQSLISRSGIPIYARAEYENREQTTLSFDSLGLNVSSNIAFSQSTIDRYRKHLINFNPDHPFKSCTDDIFLKNIGAVEEENGNITVAGLLMFGQQLLLRKVRERHLLDFRVNSKCLSDPIWAERVAWEGNLVDAYFELFPRLISGFSGGADFNSSMQSALREGFVNLLAHTDYTQKQASLIVKCPKGFYFRNPGIPSIKQRDLINGNRSEPANPNILYMFRLIGIADEAGSGIPKILHYWKNSGFQEPHISVDVKRNEFVLQTKILEKKPEAGDIGELQQILGLNPYLSHMENHNSELQRLLEKN